MERKQVAKQVSTFFTGLLMLTALFLLLTPHFGWQMYSVLSDSMRPTLQTGGLIVTHPVDCLDLNGGDVIAYGSPIDGKLVAHRVVEVMEHSRLLVRTKGDANKDVDPYLVPAENVVGRVYLHIPLLGYVFQFIRTPMGLILTLVIPGLITIGIEVKNIWSELTIQKNAFSTKRTEKLKTVSLTAVTLFLAAAIPLTGSASLFTDQETSTHNTFQAGTWVPTVDLYVDSDDGARRGWTRVGMNPYLDAKDHSTNYVYASQNNREAGDFGFTDSGISQKTITNVQIQIYARQTKARPLEVYVWDGATWTVLGAQALSTEWDWVIYDATAVLDTWTKVDGGKIYLKTTGGAGTYEIDCARLHVEYT